MKYYYTDKATAEFINSKERRIYLYGGCAGYTNFGDIIQLKNILWFYRKAGQEPVIIFRLNSIVNAQYIKNLKQWYKCDKLIFTWDELVDTENTELSPLKAIQAGGFLHLYGGGFLNKYWGQGIIDGLVDLIEDFSIDDYVVSGQQIEEKVVPYLNEVLFSKKKPLLFGVRDQKSYEFMRDGSALDIKNIYFSFDDVAEIFEAWRASSKLSWKVKIINKLKRKGILIHMNVSYYANTKQKVLERLRRLNNEFPTHKIVIAQAYNDIRQSTSDSLQSLISLENNSPYQEYVVSDFVRFALVMQPDESKYPNVANILSSVDFTISSSYHIAMLSSYFGIPTYLVSENEFYSQKQQGLGLENDLDKFLEEMPVNRQPYRDELSKRRQWLKVLEDIIKNTGIEADYRKKSFSIASVGDLGKMPYKTPKS